MNSRRMLRMALGAALAFLFPVSEGAVTRSEAGSAPLKWDFDNYLSDFQPDQNPSTRAIRFHLGTTVSTSGVQSNEWNAVRAAFGQWQALPGTKIRCEEAAPRTAPPDVFRQHVQRPHRVREQERAAASGRAGRCRRGVGLRRLRQLTIERRARRRSVG